MENAGRIIMLEDERDRVKIRFEKLNLEVKDLKIAKALEHFRDVVVAAHGVPPRILGIVTPGQLGANPLALPRGGPSASLRVGRRRWGRRWTRSSRVPGCGLPRWILRI